MLSAYIVLLSGWAAIAAGPAPSLQTASVQHPGAPAAARLSAPGVTKTIVDKAPAKASYKTAALAGKLYAFEYEDDESTDAGVLASGGHVYVYDPSARTWRTRAAMLVKKSNYSLAAVDGKVYIIGVFTAPGTLSRSVEEYDPAADRWTIRASMPTARCRIGVVVLNGRIYALGGKTERGLTDAVEEYDPSADAWTARRRLSRPLMGVHAAAVNGRIYKLKGTSLSDRGGFEMIMDFEEYDPAAGTWTPKSPWLWEKEPLEAVAIGGRFFAVGGGMYADASVRSMKEYDIASGKWIFRRDMPDPAAHTIHFTWAVLDGKLYTFGGGCRAGDGWRAFSYAQRYDPETDTWEELPSLAQNRIGMSAAVIGNSIYLLGGETTGAAAIDGQRNEYSGLMEIYEVSGAGK